jgi:cyanophycinase-like exopeptidase
VTAPVATWQTGPVPARLVIIGSGETSPTLIKIHRQLMAGAIDPVMLDTSFGFQANADDLTEKIGAYFRDSVGTSMLPARWRSSDEPLVEREQTLALLARSSLAFAGPGSPSYALRQWINTPIPAALADIVRRDGTVMMGSAAAVTLGTVAVPVYEIYKVGEDPHWLPGLNLLGDLTGLQAAVIPHYDNQEGGRHDTRYCYLGESRLELMETLLPEGVGVLGVDEHTAAIFDLSERTVSIQGAGGLTIRREGRSQTFPSGTAIDISELQALLDGLPQSASGKFSSITPIQPVTDTPENLQSNGNDAASLSATSVALKATFDACLVAADSDGALGACLELEDAIHAWSADTLQNDDVDRARQTLRSMLVDLATAAQDGLSDERESLAPVVSVALMARKHARDAKDFAMSDLLRDGLLAAGIEVRDTADGTEWDLINGE